MPHAKTPGGVPQQPHLHGLPGRSGSQRWLAFSIILAARFAHAQEGIRNSIAGQTAADAWRLSAESTRYTIKTGDFRLLVTPVLEADFNDNINSSKSNPEQDFIFRPSLGLTASYPLTQRNVLQFKVTAGYDKYFQHDELSTWRVSSDSGLSFDIFIKDFQINLHDRFNYTPNAGQEAAVASTARYGTINNTVGEITTWNLNALVLNLGYDHANVISPATEFASLDSSTELVSASAGLKVRPDLTPGLQTTASFTSYEKLVLNDNSSYSFGGYVDWRPGNYFQVNVRAGYTIFQFQHTSQSITTADINSWYANLSLSHQFSRFASYALNAGHEVRLGAQSADAIEDTFVRPSLTLNIFEHANLQASLSYEHGTQGTGNVIGNLTETYDWVTSGLGINYQLNERFSLALNYRLTVRSSSTDSRGYTQNLVSLLFTYQPK